VDQQVHTAAAVVAVVTLCVMTNIWVTMVVEHLIIIGLVDGQVLMEVEVMVPMVLLSFCGQVTLELIQVLM
jgi:hypothetical protein